MASICMGSGAALGGVGVGRQRVRFMLGFAIPFVVPPFVVVAFERVWSSGISRYTRAHQSFRDLDFCLNQTRNSPNRPTKVQTGFAHSGELHVQNRVFNYERYTRHS